MSKPFLNPSTFYQCDQCTACCRWPGDVKITTNEVQSIAAFLGLTEEEFIQNHTRLRTDRNGLSITENPDHSCSMLVKGQCVIHAVKPGQCKGFPNTWNFPGWQKICHAKPIPIQEAIQKGLVSAQDVS